MNSQSFQFGAVFKGISILFALVMPFAMVPVGQAALLFDGSPPDDDTKVTNSDTFILDDDDSAAAGLLKIQFGNLLSESISFDIDNSYFIISDALVVDGNVNIQGTTLRLDSDETGNPDADVEIIAPQGSETDGVIRFDDGDNRWEIAEQGLLVENTGTGSSFRVDDAAGDTTPFVVDETGEIGIGTASPTVDLHFLDSTSSVLNEWMLFDDGTNQVSILTGTQNPQTTATDADIGSFFFNSSTGEFYVKQNDGSTTNWYRRGFPDDIHNALVGTSGTPSSGNKFVTDQDPRLSSSGGNVGEVALGSRLGYDNVSGLVRSSIVYTRVFLPEGADLVSMGVFTTSAKTGDINFGIYSSNAAGTAPVTKLIDTTAQIGVTSPVNGFWQYNLTSTFTPSVSDFYWLAMAATENPFARVKNSAGDIFIPYRIESKLTSSSTLPTTATPAAVGNTIDLPYLAAFEL